MKRLLVFLCIAMIGVALVGAGQTTPAPSIETPLQGVPHPWTDKPLANAPETFRFAILADVTGGERPGVFDRAVETLNLLQPEFVMSVGDYIEGYAAAPTEYEKQWTLFEERLAKLQMRFFFVPGNHDVAGPSPKVAREAWTKRRGPAYYHFVYRDVLFLCLDSNLLGAPTTDPAEADRQMAYIKKTLDENAKARWTLVFLHHPLWAPTAAAGTWPEVQKLLAARKHTVFAGHIHRYTKSVRNGASYITLATTGGVIGKTEALKSGQFDEVAWVTMAPAGPVIANVKVDGVMDENVLTEEMILKEVKDRILPKGITP